MDLTPDSLSRLATGYWAAGTLSAAIELGIFDILSQRSITAADLAAAVDCRPELLPAMLDALCALELLAKRGDTYLIAPSANHLLSAASPMNMLGALAYNADLFRQWASLASVFRTGAPVVTPPSHEAPAATQRFVMGMESKARAFAPALLPLIDVGGATTLLDVGAGPGTVSRMLAERNERLRVTLLDLPDVLDFTKGIIATSPAGTRIDLHPADYRRGRLPSPFDAVLYAGALHQETPAAAAALMANCFGALRPGGCIFVVDLMLDATRTQPAFSALFQLNMLLARPDARVFSEGEVVDLLSAAGFTGDTIRHAGASPYVVITARKPL